jgi:hypothetical protein
MGNELTLEFNGICSAKMATGLIIFILLRKWESMFVSKKCEHKR